MAEGEVRKTVVVDAPPDVVFKALTNEKELGLWMTQRPGWMLVSVGNASSSTAGPRQGSNQSPTGRILELIPDKRLSTPMS